jgi:hypothetical protein
LVTTSAARAAGVASPLDEAATQGQWVADAPGAAREASVVGGPWVVAGDAPRREAADVDVVECPAVDDPVVVVGIREDGGDRRLVGIDVAETGGVAARARVSTVDTRACVADQITPPATSAATSGTTTSAA